MDGSAAACSADSRPDGAAAQLCDLAAGDLLFINGGDGPFALTVRLSGFSRWSHIGLIVQTRGAAECAPRTPPALRDRRAPPQSRLALLEAVGGPDGHRDLITGDDEAQGVRLVSLEERLAPLLPEAVGVRRLRIAAGRRDGGGGFRWNQERTVTRQGVQRQLDLFIQHEHGKPYEQSMWTLFNAWWDCCNHCGTLTLNRGANRSAFFCSEMVASALMGCGVLAEVGACKTADEYTVADFTRDNSLDLPLNPPFSYGPVTELRR